MKKQKIANYLKNGILLLGVSVLLWNCEKQEILSEEPVIVNTIDKISSVFNKEQFKEVIPYQFNVNWQDNGIKYSKELETSYYEFNISYTSSLTPYINIANKKIGDYYKSFKIIATVNKEKEFVSFYALRVYQKIQQTGEPIAKINFEISPNFNGLIHVININNQIVFAKKLEQGKALGKDYFSNEFKNLNPYKNKYLETCVTVGTYHYKDWYKKWTDEDGTHTEYVSTQYLGYSEEEICGYEWLPDSNGAGGTSNGTGTANGTGTYKGDCSNTNSKTKYYAKESEDCAVKVTEEIIEGWPEEIKLFEVIEGPAIPNIVEYLKCFDSAKGATFTIYVKQPKVNKSDTWSGPVWDADVGHTFISITQGSTSRVMGLYPASSVSPFSSNPSVSRLLVDNAGDDFDVSLTINITASQLSKLRSEITGDNSNYNLNTYNCTDFGLRMGNLFSMNIPDSTGTWPGGGGSNPGNLGQDIRSMSLNSGITRNTTGGKAVSKSGTCP